MCINLFVQLELEGIQYLPVEGIQYLPVEGLIHSHSQSEPSSSSWKGWCACEENFKAHYNSLYAYNNTAIPKIIFSVQIKLNVQNILCSVVKPFREKKKSYHFRGHHLLKAFFVVMNI